LVFSAGLGSTGLAAVGAGRAGVVGVITGVGAGGRIGVVGSVIKFVKYVFTSWRCAYSRTTTLSWSAFFPFASCRPWPKATWNIASKVFCSDGILDEDDSQIALKAATTYKIKSTNENCYQVRKDNKVHLDFGGLFGLPSGMFVCSLQRTCANKTRQMSDGIYNQHFGYLRFGTVDKLLTLAAR
jgi:hypothetical protein